MVAKKRTNRAISTDIHEEIDLQTQDTMVVETITTTTTTTTKKRIYVKDANIDLTNIQSLLDDETDTYALTAIANTASDHICQLTNGKIKKPKENEHFEKSANAIHSPLSSTKVSDEIQTDEESDPLITFNKKNHHSAPKRSATSTKSSNHKVNSPNLSYIPCDKNKDSSKAESSKDLKKRTKTISSKNMPKTPKNYKEKRIEDLISQYISVEPLEHKAKGQIGSNNIPNETNDNHNLSDIAEASFEASDSADDFVDGCGSELAENDDLPLIVQNANPIEHGNDEIASNIEKTEANIGKTSKQTPATRPQRGKRAKSTKKLKCQSESKVDDKLEGDKANETVKSVLQTGGKKARKLIGEDKMPEITSSDKKNTKKVTKETAVDEDHLKTEQLKPIEAEQIEAVKRNKRPRGTSTAEKKHEESKPKNKRSRAENTKTAKVDDPISEVTEEQFVSNKRSSRRKQVPNNQQSLRRASLEKLYAKEIKENKKAKPSKSKKLPKTKNYTDLLNEIPIDIPQVDELPDIHMDEPVMPINKNLFDHKIAIYSPSSRKNFKTDGESNVIIPEALIKSKLMTFSNAPDEWINKFNGMKEYKINASHRLRLLMPDTTENIDLNTNAKGGGDILSRIGNLRRPILVCEIGTPTKN